MRVSFSAEIEVPDDVSFEDVSSEDVEQWLKFEFGETNRLHRCNPIASVDLITRGDLKVSNVKVFRV